MHKLADSIDSLAARAIDQGKYLRRKCSVKDHITGERRDFVIEAFPQLEEGNVNPAFLRKPPAE